MLPRVQTVLISGKAPWLNVATGQVVHRGHAVQAQAERVPDRDSWRVPYEGALWSVPNDYVVANEAIIIEFRRRETDVWQRANASSREHAVSLVKKLRRQGHTTRFVADGDQAVKK